MQIDIRPGRVIFPNGTTSTAILTANAVHLCPIDIPVPVSIDRIILNVATAAAGATTGGVNPEVGLYISNQGVSTFRNILRASLLAADLTTVGNKNVLLPNPFSLPVGRIWLAIFNPTYATTQPTLRALLSNSITDQSIDTLADGAALTSQSRQVRVGGITAGLPEQLESASFTFADNLSAPILGLRVASVGVAPAVIPIPTTPANAVVLSGAVGVPSGTQADIAAGLTDLPASLPTVLR